MAFLQRTVTTATVPHRRAKTRKPVDQIHPCAWTDAHRSTASGYARRPRRDPALESARLYQDTQRRAARERVIRQVTDRMRRSVEIETILESTIVELAQALGAPRVYVRLGVGDEQPRAGAGTGPAAGSNGGEVGS